MERKVVKIVIPVVLFLAVTGTIIGLIFGFRKEDTTLLEIIPNGRKYSWDSGEVDTYQQFTNNIELTIKQDLGSFTFILYVYKIGGKDVYTLCVSNRGERRTKMACRLKIGQSGKFFYSV